MATCDASVDVAIQASVEARTEKVEKYPLSSSSHAEIELGMKSKTENCGCKEKFNIF